MIEEGCTPKGGAGQGTYPRLSEVWSVVRGEQGGGGGTEPLWVQEGLHWQHTSPTWAWGQRDATGSTTFERHVSSTRKGNVNVNANSNELRCSLAQGHTLQRRTSPQ